MRGGFAQDDRRFPVHSRDCHPEDAARSPTFTRAEAGRRLKDLSPGHADLHVIGILLRIPGDAGVAGSLEALAEDAERGAACLLLVGHVDRDGAAHAVAHRELLHDAAGRLGTREVEHVHVRLRPRRADLLLPRPLRVGEPVRGERHPPAARELHRVLGHQGRRMESVGVARVSGRRMMVSVNGGGGGGGGAVSWLRRRCACSRSRASRLTSRKRCSAWTAPVVSPIATRASARWEYSRSYERSIRMASSSISAASPWRPMRMSAKASWSRYSTRSGASSMAWRKNSAAAAYWRWSRSWRPCASTRDASSAVRVSPVASESTAALSGSPASGSPFGPPSAFIACQAKTPPAPGRSARSTQTTGGAPRFSGTTRRRGRGRGFG